MISKNQGVVCTSILFIPLSLFTFLSTKIMHFWNKGNDQIVISEAVKFDSNIQILNTTNKTVQFYLDEVTDDAYRFVMPPFVIQQDNKFAVPNEFDDVERLFNKKIAGHIVNVDGLEATCQSGLFKGSITFTISNDNDEIHCTISNS